MHVGDVADDVLPIETGHRLIYFHSVVECSVANKLIEKLATKNVGEKWR